MSYNEEQDTMTGRQREYERLVAPIEDRMIRTVWRVTRDPQDAEDAFQDALLTLWKRWDRIGRHANPHALILHICINAALDVLRRKARQGKSMQPGAVLEDAVDPSPSVFQKMSSAEQAHQLRRAIGFLSKNQARAILMHAVEEMPYSEISAALECGEGTARKHVARARTRLRTLLSNLIPAVHKEERSRV